MLTMSCKVPPEHAELVRAAGGGKLLRQLVADWVADQEERAVLAAYAAQPDDDAVIAVGWPADLDDDADEWQAIYDAETAAAQTA